MKNKIILGLIMLTTLFLGCKNEKSVDDLEVVKSEIVNKFFEVELNVLVKKNDDFCLFYSQDGSTDFTKIAPIWKGVKGSESYQKIVFTLPEEIIPTNIRIDFGINKDQEPMIINNYKMSYAGKSFEAPGAGFFKFFAANLACTAVDKEKGLIIPVKNGGKYFGPSFYPEIILSQEISKLIK